MTEPDDTDYELTDEQRDFILNDPGVPEVIRDYFIEGESWPGGPRGREEFWLLAAADPTIDPAIIDEDIARTRAAAVAAEEEAERLTIITKLCTHAYRLVCDASRMANAAEIERLAKVVEHIAPFVNPEWLPDEYLPDEDDDQ